MLLALVAAAGASGAQIYRWTDDKGRVHYGESLPPGQRADSVTQQQATVPLPPPSARDLEIRRRQEEYADRADRERDEKERAALRNTPAGIYYCQQIEQSIQKAQSGPLPRYDRPGAYATEDERKAFLKEMLDLREKNCR